METPTMKTLFGPIDRKYCDWFYYLSVVSFFFMLLTLVSGSAMVFQNKMKMKYVFAVLWSAAMYAVFYFQNRLLYTMCVK